MKQRRSILSIVALSCFIATTLTSGLGKCSDEPRRRNDTL